MTRTAQRARILKAADEAMRIDWSAINRIERESRAHLDTLSPERRAQLEESWK